MSNIYVLEPPTSGKVLLHTSFGDLDIELYAKETPLACKNFVQLCLEGYYDNCPFHRVVKGFIAQTGDPTGTGEGGESIYDNGSFRDEFHQRLKFSRRGLVAMANSDAHDNRSQFFFTLEAAPELNSRHTLFGKITGDTIYNLLKLNDIDVDSSDRPMDLPRITSAEVLNNPFPDIVLRVDPVVEARRAAEAEARRLKKRRPKGRKDFSVLSFGDEAAETEEFVSNTKLRKGAIHDLTEDDTLTKPSSLNVISTIDSTTTSRLASSSTEIKLENVEEKKKEHKNVTKANDIRTPELSKADMLRAEAEALKQQLVSSRLTESRDSLKREAEAALDRKKKKHSALNEERSKYFENMKTAPARKSGKREADTLALLARFKAKLGSNELEKDVENSDNEVASVPTEIQDEEEESILVRGSDTGWLSHTLEFSGTENVLANDPSKNRNNDPYQYELYDPRNPLNVRRRTAQTKEKKYKRGLN